MATIERGVPQNIEAEEATLGSILIDDNALYTVASFLRPGHFYVEKNGWIFRAFLSISERRDPIDVLTVCDELERWGQLQEAGGAAYLTSLLNAVPTAIHVEHYARLVERTAVLRQLIAAAGEIARISYESTGDADEALDQAEQVIFEIAQGRVSGDFVPLSQILASYLEQLDRVKEGAATLGLPTGFADLNKLTGGLQPGDLIILAARPSVGKTALGLNIAHHVAVKERMPVAIFSLEMSREQLAHRLLCAEANIDSQRLRLGQYDEDELRRISRAFGVLSEAPIYVDDTASINVIELRSKARRLYLERDIRLVIIDYLQLMQGRRAESRVQEISDISRSLKGLAKELNVPVVAISQLSRAPELRSEHRPRLSDLRESGCLTGDTLVTLADSGAQIPVRDLVGRSGFYVWALSEQTMKLEAMPASRAFATGRKPVYRLQTRLGRVVHATGNHRFRTLSGWRRLDMLKIGDRIALPRKIECGARDTVSHAEAALLGHLIGDGCTLPHHAIQYTSHEIDLAQCVADLAQQVFGDRVQPRVQRERQWYQVYLSATEHLTHRVRNPVADWLDTLGVFGLRSYEKRVPEVMFQQSAEVIATFLCHLWATDGCIRPPRGRSRHPSVYYATASEGLARGVQSLLLRLGINAVLRSRDQGSKGRTQFHVMILGHDDILTFASEIGTVGAKSSALAECREWLQGRVANTNRDIIPSDVWRQLAVPAMQRKGITIRQLQQALGMSYMGTGLYRQNVSRERAARLARTVGGDERIAALSASDVYWDEIVSIEPDGEHDVYDLTVPGPSNFVANDFIVHNSIEQDADVVIFIYREELYDPDTERQGIADILVAKHRNGPTGQFGLYFFKETTRFANLAIQEESL